MFSIEKLAKRKRVVHFIRNVSRCRVAAVAIFKSGTGYGIATIGMNVFDEGFILPNFSMGNHSVVCFVWV